MPSRGRHPLVSRRWVRYSLGSKKVFEYIYILEYIYRESERESERENKYVCMITEYNIYMYAYGIFKFVFKYIYIYVY